MHHLGGNKEKGNNTLLKQQVNHSVTMISVAQKVDNEKEDGEGRNERGKETSDGGRRGVGGDTSGRGGGGGRPPRARSSSRATCSTNRGGWR